MVESRPPWPSRLRPKLREYCQLPRSTQPLPNQQLSSNHIDTTSTANNVPVNKSRSTSDASSSQPMSSPEFRPTQQALSPLIGALNGASVSISPGNGIPNEWARRGMAGSPGNLISLSGESPPTQPSSYEDSGARLHHGWGNARAIMTPSPASQSPSSFGRRPLSYQMDANYLSGETPPQSYGTSQRRSSMNAAFPARPGGLSPSIGPSHPYPSPSHGIGAKPAGQAGLQAGDHGLFFGFDTLPGDPTTATDAGAVTLAGYHGGLRVQSVGKHGSETIYNLRRLRGAVTQAKIVPWTMRGEMEGLFPLVAVVIHGPVVQPPATLNHDQDATVKKDTPAPTTIDAYQTTVEVYSLKSNQLVDVLLQGPTQPINSEISITSPLFQPPPAAGDFHLHVGDNMIAAASGTSGECWLFAPLFEAQNGHAFSCFGKLWTCVQPGIRTEVQAEPAQTITTPSTLPSKAPILSISGRWIAYTPATPSSQIALRVHVPTPVLGRAPGLSAAAPPQLPAATTHLDSPLANSMMNKVMRETTQELIQGAKWVGQQGLQAWNAYWSKPAPQAGLAQSPPAPNATHFPPTHGTTSVAALKDPGLICIVDAFSMTESSTIHPLASFPSPGGCSFLSLSPSSLKLFVASSKGDIQTVWDLLRLQHSHLSHMQTAAASNNSAGPLVRPVAQFSRMTVARIVDVAWSEPYGNKLAVVTERGTIHLLELPFSATTWPPMRRQLPPGKPAIDDQSSPATAVSIATGALGAAYQAAKPFVSRSRRSSVNATAPPAPTLRESAAQGGRAIAATITSSIGKTGTAIGHLRHTRDSRASLPPGPTGPSPGCLQWVGGKRAVLHGLCNGVVRRFNPHLGSPSAGQGKASWQRSSRSSRYTDIRLLPLPDDAVAPIVRKLLDSAADDNLDLSDLETDIGNTMTLKRRPVTATNESSLAAAITQAEIETSAPYQPFHTDRRVGIAEYQSVPVAYASQTEANNDTQPDVGTKKKRKQAAAQQSTATLSSGTWAFGQDMPCTAVDTGLPPATEDDLLDDGGPAYAGMERLLQYNDTEQIVVTTRRRRGARSGENGEDGFFEDDCEVLDFADQRV